MLRIVLSRALTRSALEPVLSGLEWFRTALAAVQQFPPARGRGEGRRGAWPSPAPGDGSDRVSGLGLAPHESMGRPVATSPARPERMQGLQARQPQA